MKKSLIAANSSNSTEPLLNELCSLIEEARNAVAIHVNSALTLLYWQIGSHINSHLKKSSRAEYGQEILASLSLELTAIYGKGYSYSALTRMSKIAAMFGKKIVATVSQQFSWSHFVELSSVEDELKRNFYLQLCKLERWSVRELRNQIDKMLFERSAIAKQPKNLIKQELTKLQQSQTTSPDLVFRNSYVLDFLGLDVGHSEVELEQAIIRNLEEFILEIGSGFAFLERQKRISIDQTDYYLDLLFYHRKLKRLVAIDLKLGRFKPEYKAQMELYLRWLQQNEKQKDENDPIGLLLCSEGNSDHIELMMLDSSNIRVAQYLTELPPKKWFEQKLEKAIKLAKLEKKKNE